MPSGGRATWFGLRRCIGLLVGVALLAAVLVRATLGWLDVISDGQAVVVAITGIAMLVCPGWRVTVPLLGLLAYGVLEAPRYRFEWGRIWLESRYPAYLVGGFVTTLWISAIAMVLGLALGFGGGLLRLSRRPTLRQFGTVYVEVVRGTPFLVQLFVAYYCFAPLFRSLWPSLAPVLDSPAAVGVLALGFFAGAYVTEIVRAAVESIDRGQTEAALAQGMTPRQVLWHVLLPQSLRRMIPPLTGELVSVVKDSSLLSIIAVSELAKRASEVQASTYKTYEVILPLALLYLAITFPLSRLARRLELRQRA